jgi:hypothetical protein
MQPQMTFGWTPENLGRVRAWAQRHNRRLVVSCCVVLLLVSLGVTAPAVLVRAAPAPGVSPDASCATLTGRDGTATNGATWGKTIFPGHGAANGWFGVDVCGNGINSAAPNGANVSCDRVPANWAQTGCAPGSATSDGFGLTFQCVELAIRFSAWAFGDRAADWGRSGWGNASDLWLKENHPSDFVMYPNGSPTPPVAGDILVWGYVDAKGQPWPAGPDDGHSGHIGVVAAVRDGVVTTAEQNVKWGDQDHPSDKLALVHIGSQWVLSGSIQHQTTLPTYRWLSTMGTSRATYGWLHNVHNTGTFPSKATQPSHGAGSAPGSKSPATTPRDRSGGLPSLAPAALVASNGALADLTWSSSDRFTASPVLRDAYATARGLGAPPGVPLAANQVPAVVLLPSGARYVYAVGVDGQLYSAYTAPNLLGVTWAKLSAPAGLTLQAPVSASAFSGGIAVGALATDGTLWWRAGPAASPGDWQPLGRPDGVALTGCFVLAGAPGLGTPMVLALGSDGALYERVWQAALNNADGSVQVPAGWSDWVALHERPAGANWSGTLLAVPEVTDVKNWVGSWPDVPLDVLVLDTDGHLWQLRAVSGPLSWTVTQIPASVHLTSLLGATIVSPDTTAPTPVASAAPATQSASATPAATATLGTSAQTSGAHASAALHIYAASAAVPYANVVPIVAGAGTQTSTGTTAKTTAPAWVRLPTAAPVATARPLGVALPLGAGASVLVLTDHDQMFVGGNTSSVQVLLPDLTAPADDVTSLAPWTSLGHIVGGLPFDDPLATSTLDAGWSLRGEQASARPTTQGVALVPGSVGVASLLQPAATGDMSLTVALALPAHLDRGVSAGLILYLDDGDWITLTLSGSNPIQATMCEMSAEKSVPCAQMPVQLAPTTRALWLRLQRRGQLYSSATSLDGVIWHAAGQWRAILPTNASAAAPGATPDTGAASASPVRTATVTATVTATKPTSTPSAASLSPTNAPAATLAFAEWGIWTQAAPGTDGGVRFLNFSGAADLHTVP